MKQLIIAEKPSVAQNIAAALKVNGRKEGYIENDSYIISWCVGHLVGLAAADAIRAGFADLKDGADYDALYSSRCAAQRQIGLSESMRPAFSLVCIIKP